MKLHLDAPINKLSFGQVSYNLLRAFIELGHEVYLHPISNNLDFSAFDVQKDLGEKISESIKGAAANLNRGDLSIKLWHLNGAERTLTDNATLYTFYELDEPTKAELAIARRFDKVVFSSTYSKEIFEQNGVKSFNCPVGFDPDLKIVDTRKRDFIHWGIMGKFEKRKHTERVIKLWLKRFGNNPRHRLTCFIDNVFINPQEMHKLKVSLFEGVPYKNIQFLGFMPKNSQVNDYLNSIDIDISGLGTEGWGLPSFNATALGKWSIVLNGAAQKDWANENNAILVEPTDKIECYDGRFFVKGSPFNQGNIFTWEDEALIAAFDTAVRKYSTQNTEGIKLQTEFSYHKMAERLLEIAV